jgi:hypothetical protein
LRCCAICFFVASVIGNIFLRYPCVKAWFVPFYSTTKQNVIWFSIFVTSIWFYKLQPITDFISSGSCLLLFILFRANIQGFQQTRIFEINPWCIDVTRTFIRSMQ